MLRLLPQLAQTADNNQSLWIGSTSDAQLEEGLHRYLTWTEEAERQLKNHFIEPDLVDTLHSARYWHIRELTPRAPRPQPLVNAEYGNQAALFRATAEVVLETFAVLASRHGEALILDTNVFMQCILFNDVDWRKEYERDRIRLIVPMIVLDEIDDKTFSANKRLSTRADKVLRVFDQFMDDLVNDGAAAIRPDVTLEVLRDEDNHRRRGNSDTELLDRAEFLHQVIERPITVVTADRGMRVRGKARGIRIWAMPDHLRLPPGQEA